MAAMLLDAILSCDVVKSILANHETKKCASFPSFVNGVGSRDLAALMILPRPHMNKRSAGDSTRKLHPPHERLLSK